jgi:non-ribosomal peptide synthetase component F
MEPVPTGVRGELYIGGAGVGRGYRGEPQLTAQSFVPDPFAGEHCSRLYRTGDVVRYLSDGRLEFCGRTDHQVKLRGYRIELGEIETVLREQQGIKDAIVDVREDSGNKQLIAYIIHDRQYSAN